MDLSTLQTNSGLEKKGVLIPYEDGEVKFLIAAHGNPKHKARMAAMGQQYPQHRIRNKPELVDMIAGECMADAILLGWEGPLTIKGRVLDPAKRADRLEALSYKTLREWIADQATNPAWFQDPEATTETEGDPDADALKSGD